jgi:SAM-dependent methyltransferase
MPPAAPVTKLDTINHGMMESRTAVAHYSKSERLSDAEAAALRSVAGEAAGKPILDIGVGGGRTVKSLVAVSSDYLGVDYSAAFVESVSRRYPGVRFRHADARDMPFLPEASIHLAMFSCNGIGMVSHEDRLKIMREVHRVLVPGGVFLFSTHNLDRSDDQSAARFRFPGFDFSRNPARLLVRSARFARGTAVRVYNRWRLRNHTERTPTYAILNDACHDHGVLLYHITLEQQRIQLEEAGYAPGALAFDEDGNIIDGRTEHSSLMMIARKA